MHNAQEDKRGLFILVNPTAGKGQSQLYIKEIEKKLSEKNMKYQIAYTEYPGHGTEIISQLNEKIYSKIVSMGGDGTLNEVLNGVKNLNKITLGIIPNGTGNDFIRSIGIPQNIVQALDVVLEGKERGIDIGVINNKRFINVAGTGLDVVVLEETRKLKRLIKGPLAYVMALIKALVTFKSQELEFVVDGIHYKEEVMLCAIGNGKFYGGGMKITAHAEMSDRLLDICIIRKMSKLRLLYLFPRVFKGKHIDLPWVLSLRGKRIEILSQAPIFINTDGEISLENNPVFQVMDEQLKIMTRVK